MKPALFLITNNFPFGRGESFLHPELTEIKQFFSKVIILSKNQVDAKTSEVDASIYRINLVSPWSDYVILPLLMFRHFLFLAKILFDEVGFIANHGGLKFSSIQKMLHDASKALLLSKKMETIINKEIGKQPVILYSYWLNNSALATMITFRGSKGITRISRAHSGDLYEYRHQSNYLSFRRTLLIGLDQVLSISEDGKRYLLSTVGDNYSEKISVSRLGTANPKSFEITTDTRQKFCVASCSYLLPVKQVDKILRAVALASKNEIRHVHIGGGSQEGEINKLAQTLSHSNPNSTFYFTGNIPQTAIGDVYLNEMPSIFINASKNEGIPVTMMEAMSYGIPVIAPDVGAIHELVTWESGLLLSPNPTEEDFANAITTIRTMPEHEYLKLREGARKVWETKFNAAVNFPNFAQRVLNLSHAV